MAGGEERILRGRIAAMQNTKKITRAMELIAGTPEPIIRAMCANGLDILEVGVPFSDPTADGPVIQRSSERALARGVTLEGVLAAVRRIEIRTRRLVEEVFSGEYHSVFKGTGMEFREVREYVPGDDVRTIDWNVTARTGDPFVKLFEEERELTVVLAVDMSRSGWFGSGERNKVEVAAELCALLAFSAVKNSVPSASASESSSVKPSWLHQRQ